MGGYDLLVGEELSMWSTNLLLPARSLAQEIQIIIFGDVHQLPPVNSPTFPLFDITSTYKSANGPIIPNCELTFNFRSGNSHNNELSEFQKNVRNKKCKLISSPKFVKIIAVDKLDDIDKEISSIFSQVGYQFEPDIGNYFSNISDKKKRRPQIITAYNTTRVKVSKAVQILKYGEELRTLKYAETGENDLIESLHLRDDVISSENVSSDQIQVYNGQPGIVVDTTTVDDETKPLNKDGTFQQKHIVVVRLNKDGSIVTMDASVWKPSYCSTVHKSQGSKYNVVIYVVNDYFYSVNAFYTAITRAEKFLFIIHLKKNKLSIGKDLKVQTIIKDKLWPFVNRADLL